VNIFEEKLLTKIIKENKLPKKVNSAHFVDRQPLMEYIENFYKKYSQIPSIVAIIDGGFDFEFVEVNNPIEYYEDKIIFEANKRNIGLQMTKMMDAVQNEDLENTADLAFNLYKNFTRETSGVSYSDLDKVDEMYDFRNNNKGKSWKFNNFSSLHQNITSLYGGDFHVIAGRPKQGKTYVALSMVIDLFKQGAKVGIASAEMGLEDMIQRSDMLLTGLNPDYFENGSTSAGYRRLIKKKRKEALKQGGDMHFIGFEADNDLYTGTVWDLAREIKDYNLDVLLIDSLYAYNTKSKKHSTWENTAEIVKDAVSLTRQFKVLTFVTTQLNRQATQKKGSPSSENVSFSDSFLMFCDSITAISSDQSMQQAGMRKLDVLDVRRGSPGERIISFKFGVNLEIKDLEDDEIEDERDMEDAEFEFNF